MIGLSGAHRTGKTTLAKAVAEYNEVPLVLTKTSEVFERMGLNPKIDYPFDVRLDIQERILVELTKQWESVPGGTFVTDRTPIDLMAYTLADVQREAMMPELEDRLQKYLAECVRVCNRLFSVIVVVQPGIELKDAPGKAGINQGYIEHHNALVLGLVVSENIHAHHYYIPRRKTALNDRVSAVNAAINRAATTNERQLKDAREAGAMFH